MAPRPATRASPASWVRTALASFHARPQSNEPEVAELAERFNVVRAIMNSFLELINPIVSR